MPKGIFSNLGEFISVGGHIETGIMIGQGYEIARIEDYVSSRVPSAGGQEINLFLAKVTQGVDAARIQNGLGPNESLPPGIAPIFSEQYGDSPDGRRVTTVATVSGPNGENAKDIRLETEDWYTREELDAMFRDIWEELVRKYPEKFTGAADAPTAEIQIMDIYTSGRF